MFVVGESVLALDFVVIVWTDFSSAIEAELSGTPVELTRKRVSVLVHYVGLLPVEFESALRRGGGDGGRRVMDVA